MTRSDSSDSGRSRKHRKKSKRRSRSNSSSSEERSRKSRKHRRKDDHRRSRSRERRRSRSRDRKRSRTRSRERKKSRSRSRSKSPLKSQKYSSGWDETSKQPKLQSRGSDIDETEEKLTLKEKIKLLTGKTDQSETITPSLEQLKKIESENFLQESYTSTYIDPSAQPKQKKKKKNKQKQATKTTEEHVTETKVEQYVEPVSHEDAMFANTMDTLHVTKFTKIDGKRKEELKTVESEDVIFGAMFFDDPEVRMKRWINKLTNIRKKLLEEKE